MKSLGIKDINKKTEPESWIVEDTELANASDQDSEGDSSQEQDESEDEENSDNENQATVLVADSKRNHTLSVPAAPSASKKSAGGSNFVSHAKKIIMVTCLIVLDRYSLLIHDGTKLSNLLHPAMRQERPASMLFRRCILKQKV